MAGGWKTGGLYDKYHVERKDGTPCDPEAQYFVLRVDEDPHALKALKCYAVSVRTDNARLADDIEKWVLDLQPADNE